MTLVALTLAATNVVLVSPWSNGTFGTTSPSPENGAGNCWIRSLATDRPDVWRCMAGNDIYDPCFVSPKLRDRRLHEGPFSKNVVLIASRNRCRVRRTLSIRTSELRALRLRGEPWGLRLLDGETCVYMTGATDVVADMRLNYACTNGWGLGLPDRSTAIWKVSYIVSLQKRTLRKMGIATAIF